MTAQQWVYELHAAIAHGDDEHRKWLLDAILAFSEGCPVPAPRGSGKEDALRATLARVTAERDAAVADVAQLASTEHEDRLYERNEALDSENTRLADENRDLRAALEDANRRALGHAYAAHMAEGGETIVEQENARLRREEVAMLAEMRALRSDLATAEERALRRAAEVCLLVESIDRSVVRECRDRILALIQEGK